MKRVVLLCLLVLATTAHADRKTAERYFRAGAKAYQAQNFDAAATNFDRAYEALPVPEIAFSAAQAHRRQFRVESDPKVAAEHARKAIALYKAYLDKVKKGARVADASDSLGEMENALSRVGPVEKTTPAAAAPAAKRTALGVTVVFADQTTSSVLREIDDDDATEQKVTTLIDGKPVPPDELVVVEPGEHVVRAEADGYIPVERKVKVVKDNEDFENLELQPKPARLAIATEAGAHITVDGREQGIAPADAIELPAGKHLVVITRRGRRSVSRELVLTRGQDVPISVELDKTLKRRAVPWVFGGAALLGGLTLVSMGGWVIYENRAERLARQLDMGDQPASVGAAYNNAITMRDRVAIGTLVMGSAALLVTGLGFSLYYFDTPGAGISGRF